MTRPLAITLVAIVVGVWSAGEWSPVSFAQPTEQSATTAVLVDVVVRDRAGRLVTDLTAADFELREEGERQEVGSFTRVSRGAGIGVQVGLRDPSAPVLVSPSPPGDGSGDDDAARTPMTTALVFDALTAQSLEMCQRAALTYLPRNAVGGDVQVGVFVTEPTARALQTYTDHPALVRQAVSRVVPAGTSMKEQQAERTTEMRARRDQLEAQQASASAAEGGNLGAASGAMGQLALERRVVQGQLRLLDAFESLDRDHRGMGTSAALLSVLQTLVERPGRKTVVFFSEGLPASPTLQARLQGLIDVANRLNVSIYAIDATGLRAVSGTSDTRRALEEHGAARLAQLARVRDEAEEPMTRAMERQEDLLVLDSQTGLARLAGDTGGFLVRDTNDLADAFRRIDEDMRFHYLLTYVPTNQVMDGSFRRIGVRVRRPGVTVFARRGYRALRSAPSTPPLDYETPALRALDAAVPPRLVPFGATALGFPEPTREGLVLPVVRLLTRALTYERDEAGRTYHAQATIVARFRDSRGRVVERVSQQYLLSGQLHELDAAQQGEILFYKEPVLPPGVYTMEVAVHDDVAGRAGVRVATVDVPALVRGRARLSSLVVVRRSEQVQPDVPIEHPLVTANTLMYPSTGEPVSRAQDREVAFYFVAYGTVGPEARVQLKRSGRLVSEAPIALSAPDDAGRRRQAGRIPVDGLEDGLYEVVVMLPAGTDMLQRSAYVTVVP